MITLDMCSLPILLLLIVTTLARRATKGAVNRTFLFILFIVTVDTIFDAGAIQVNTHYMAGQTYYYALLEASKITYLLLRNMTSFVLMLLVYAITRTAYKLKSKKSIFFMAMPLYIIMGLLLTNPLHHLIFTITPGAGYAHGPLSFLLYAVSTAYAAYGLGYLIRYSKFISKERFFTLVAIFAIQLVAVLVQYFVKVMRFEMFGATVGCLLMVLVVLRPEEIIDAATGLLSWNAYKREIGRASCRERVCLSV